MLLNDTLSKLSLAQLKQAVQLKEQITILENQMAAIFDGDASLSSPPLAIRQDRGGPRAMSPAARARIAAAQKARWAKFHAARGTIPAKSRYAAAPRAGGMSAAGRARIIAAQKARWARFRAQQGR